MLTVELKHNAHVVKVCDPHYKTHMLLLPFKKEEISKVPELLKKMYRGHNHYFGSYIITLTPR